LDHRHWSRCSRSPCSRFPEAGSGPRSCRPAARSIQPTFPPFLLNIALVLFAWRRSVQLKKTFAERDAAEERAYELAHRDEVTG
jgi:hypothetical protein